MENDVIYDFSVWLRTGYNPADINLFQFFIGKHIIDKIYIL